MKKTVLFTIILFAAIFSFAQHDSTAPILPPYQRFPDLPPFRLLKVDSVTYFGKADVPKNKPVLIILFDPNCDHCQHETEDITNNIDSFQNIQIVMVTNADFKDTKKFYENYGLAKFKNITIGVETVYFLATFFNIHNLPYLAMYDKKGKLISTHEGTWKVEKILETFR